MPDSNAPKKGPVGDSRFGGRWPWIVCLGFALVLIVAFLIPRPRPEPALHQAAASGGSAAPDQPALASLGNSPRHPTRDHADAPNLTAEQIVASKVAQFGRKRRELVYSIARRSQKEVPPEVEKFFDAVESGNWLNITNQWRELATHSSQYEFSTNHWDQLDAFWPSVLDAYGVAEQAHLWPAQKLLDYGNTVMGALRPGMVYVGGTDNGRWVPELMNETSDGEQHIIVTQNALADGRYLDFVNDLYSDRMSTLTQDESKRAFEDYISDAQKRFEHDQQFPDRPKQVLPGEDIQVVDGKVQVRGQVAVMAINERLLQMLTQKNPDMSFAIEQSFPFRDTYADALPLGPLMELNARNDQNTFTAERAAQSLDYWRNAAQQVLSDVDASNSEYELRSYSHGRLSSGKPARGARFQFTSRRDLSARDATLAGQSGVRRRPCQSARGDRPPGRSPTVDGQLLKAISRSTQNPGEHRGRRNDHRHALQRNRIETRSGKKVWCSEILKGNPLRICNAKTSSSLQRAPTGI